MQASDFIPRRSTLILFAVMVLLWLPVYRESFGDYEGLGIPILVISFVGLCGVYGSLAVLERPRPERKVRFLALVFVRTALIGGGSAALASFFEV